jgi:hypothetical protein
MINVQVAVLDTLPDMMEFCVNVLASSMLHRVLAQGDCRLIVDPQNELALSASGEITNEAIQPNTLTCRGRRRDVLRLAGRQCDDLLLLRGPCDDVAPEEEDNAGGALSVINVPGKVTVAVPNKSSSTSILRATSFGLLARLLGPRQLKPKRNEKISKA